MSVLLNGDRHCYQSECPESGRRLYLKLKVVIELTVVFTSRRMKLYLGWHWDESMSRLQFQLIRIPIAAPWEDTQLSWLVAQKRAALLLCSDNTHKCAAGGCGGIFHSGKLYLISVACCWNQLYEYVAILCGLCCVSMDLYYVVCIWVSEHIHIEISAHINEHNHNMNKDPR